MLFQATYNRWGQWDKHANSFCVEQGGNKRFKELQDVGWEIHFRWLKSDPQVFTNESTYLRIRQVWLRWEVVFQGRKKTTGEKKPIKFRSRERKQLGQSGDMWRQIWERLSKSKPWKLGSECGLEFGRCLSLNVKEKTHPKITSSLSNVCR